MKPAFADLMIVSLFFLGACAQPVPQLPPATDLRVMPQDFADLSELSPSIAQDIRYFGIHNFLGRQVTGYHAPKCILTRKAAEALGAVQAELKEYSLGLKVYDCYRPQVAVDDFVAWASDLNDKRMKKEFYPGVDKTNLFRDGYIAEKSGHSRGSTMDLTIVPLPLASSGLYRDGDKLAECFQPVGKRFQDNSLDMGTGYDCFDPLAHTANPAVSSEQKRDRLLLKSIMEKHGFKNLPEEWWHYTLVNEPYPATFFNFEIK